ncbi:hypothetical protein HDV06_005052 [Boothiomyces sp. JEL0866]|nr:hypothetical protein HDV06_005052 [Boothiomyces sp. JEL0866]
MIVIIGATGRIGSRVMEKLLPEHKVTAIVRKDIPQHPNLTTKSFDDLDSVLSEATVVVSCLGHVPSPKALFEPLFVTEINKKVGEHPGNFRFIQLNSGGVNNPHGGDARPFLDKVIIGGVGWLTPFRDSIHSALYISSLKKEWCCVRPVNFIEGEGEYEVFEHATKTVFAGATAKMGSIADFISKLATDDALWNKWKFKMPMLYDK